MHRCPALLRDSSLSVQILVFFQQGTFTNRHIRYISLWDSTTIWRPDSGFHASLYNPRLTGMQPRPTTPPAVLPLQQTGCCWQLAPVPTPMAVMGMQSRPMLPVKSWRMPSDPRRLITEGLSAGCRESQQLRLPVLQLPPCLTRMLGAAAAAAMTTAKKADTRRNIGRYLDSSKNSWAVRKTHVGVRGSWHGQQQFYGPFVGAVGQCGRLVFNSC